MGLKKFMEQIVTPWQTHYQEDDAQTAIPQKLNQYIKEQFNLSQQHAIRCITASTTAPSISPFSFNSNSFAPFEQAKNTKGKGIMLLQGPPGTGKTATIIGALSVLVARGVSTLVCSSSNHAVDDIARKVATRGLVGEDGTSIRPFGMPFLLLFM